MPSPSSLSSAGDEDEGDGAAVVLLLAGTGACVGDDVARLVVAASDVGALVDAALGTDVSREGAEFDVGEEDTAEGSVVVAAAALLNDGGVVCVVFVVVDDEKLSDSWLAGLPLPSEPESAGRELCALVVSDAEGCWTTGVTVVKTVVVMCNVICAVCAGSTVVVTYTTELDPLAGLPTGVFGVETVVRTVVVLRKVPDKDDGVGWIVVVT